MKKTGKRNSCLRMADGGVLMPAPRPVSPYSLRGIGQGLASAYQGTVGAVTDGMEAAAPSLRAGYNSVVGSTTDAMEAIHNRFARPSMPAAPAVLPPEPLPGAQAVEPAAQPTPTIGGAANAIRAHQQALSELADGSPFVGGKGGPVDDKVDAKLSVGESVLPADTTAIVGKENIRNLIAETHTPADMQRQGVPPGGRHAARRGLRLANGIAGLDVSESPFTEADARTFGTRPAGTIPTPEPRVPGVSVSYGNGGISDPGPGNPALGDRVGPVRPATATTPAAAEPAAVPQSAAAAESAGYRGARAVGSRIATGLRAGVPLVIAGEVAQNLGSTKVSNDVAPVDSSALGTLRYVANGDFGGFGHSVANGDLGGAVRSAANGDFGNVGESLRKGAVEAGADVAKGLAGAGDILLPGTPLTDRLNARLREDLGPQAAPQPSDTVGAGRGHVNPPQVTATQTQTQASPGAAPPLDNSVIPGGTQAAQIMRRGNSFTNTGTFAEDVTPGGGPSAANIAAADRVAARSTAGLRGGLEDNSLPAGAGVTAPGVNAPASQYERDLANHNAGVSSTFADRGLSNRQRMQRDIAARAEATQRDLAAQRDTTERRGQDIASQTARAGNAVTLRGQDLGFASTTRGQDMTARTAANQARMEQMNKDRQFQFDVTKHGDEIAKQRFDMRQAAEKNVHEQIANMLPPGADGKPDLANAARYATGLNAMVAQQQQVLEARARQGDQHAAAALDDLSRNGLGALDPAAIRSYVQGIKVNDLRAKYGTPRFNPVGGTDVITDTPAAGLRKTSNGFFGLGGEYTVMGNHGENLGTVPARAVEGDGSFIGGKRRVDLRDFVR